jgi:putative heme iron utilization protein
MFNLFEHRVTAGTERVGYAHIAFNLWVRRVYRPEVDRFSKTFGASKVDEEQVPY